MTFIFDRGAIILMDLYIYKQNLTMVKEMPLEQIFIQNPHLMRVLQTAISSCRSGLS